MGCRGYQEAHAEPGGLLLACGPRLLVGPAPGKVRRLGHGQRPRGGGDPVDQGQDGGGGGKDAALAHRQRRRNPGHERQDRGRHALLRGGAGGARRQDHGAPRREVRAVGGHRRCDPAGRPSPHHPPLRQRAPPGLGAQGDAMPGQGRGHGRRAAPEGHGPATQGDAGGPAGHHVRVHRRQPGRGPPRPRRQEGLRLGPVHEWLLRLQDLRRSQRDHDRGALHGHVDL
mmetsp:Transcript_59942/g.147368  ORF Transcript_59942/g.147368 Transcript_59942/m.147368 type:complete len:228 (-) Transcript_59942:1267-1950(-)